MHVISESFDPTRSERDLIEALTAFIPDDMRRRGVPGASIALGRGGRMIWRGAFGSADLARATPMAPDHVFKSGSMGKTITGTAIMQLVERGVLALDEAADAHLDFPVTNPFGGPVTVRHLLTHTSGLGATAAGSVTAASTFRSLEETVRSDLRLGEAAANGFGALTATWIAAPGTTHSYANLGIALLGLIVQNANEDGLSYPDYVQTHIFNPLGMTTSQYPFKQDKHFVRPDIWALMMTGHMVQGRTALKTPEIYFEQSPAGAFLSTPSDHLKFLMAIAAGGALNGTRILGAPSVAAMLTDQNAPVAMGPHRQGLIWWLYPKDDRLERFDHGGAHMFGFTNQGAVWPDADLAMSAATNAWNMANMFDATSQGALEFIDQWVRLGGFGAPVLERSWAWKLSFVRGGRFIEAFNGFLGLRDPVTMEDAHAAAASLNAQAARAADWDAEGFLAGAEAMLEVSPTPEGVARFAAACPLSPADIRRAFHLLEGPEGMRPPSFWTTAP